MGLFGFYEIGGAVHLLARGEHLRIALLVQDAEMEMAAREILARLVSVLDKGTELGLFLPGAGRKHLGEVMLSLSVLPIDHPSALISKDAQLGAEARERLERIMAQGSPPMPQIDEEEEEWVKILPDDLVERMAKEGVS